jgi:NADH-quinone oxidoreductase subunit M
LPDAHVEAPTAGSVILAGVLLKFGVYGMMRWAIPLFPNAAQELTWVIATLAVVGIVYGAMVAFAQEDVKKLVAYSSVSHLGFCVLGLFALNTKGIEGSIFTMLSHGLTTSGLFLGIGVLYERRHTRKLAEFGGLWSRMPVFAGLFLVVMLGSVGLPGLSGFVGEFLTLLGAFDAGARIPYAWSFSMVGALGVILGAVYLLWMFQKLMFGPITNERNQQLPDLSAREIAVFLPIVAFTFLMGLYPRPFLRAMEPSVTRLIESVERKERVATAVPMLVVPPAAPPAASPAPPAAPAAPPAASPPTPASPTPAPLTPRGGGH